MSNFLHNYVAQKVEQPMQVHFKGTGVGFSCFTPHPAGGLPKLPEKMLWVAGGVGITPFMAMWEGIIKVANTLQNHISSDIILLFSGRGDDIDLLKHFLTHDSPLPDGLNIRVLAFQSVGENPDKAQLVRDTLSNEFSDSVLRIEQRRLQLSDLETLTDLSDRHVFLCGPDALMSWSETALKTLKVNQAKIHREQFGF